MIVDRLTIRRKVIGELWNVRNYRQAMRTCKDAHERTRMSAWVRVADDTLASLRDEYNGQNIERYIDEYFGLRKPPKGNTRYVTMKAMDRYHMSEDGLRRWRDAAVYNASILAVSYGVIDLSNE